MKPQIEAVRLRPVYRALLALAGVCAIAAFVGYAYALAHREDDAARATIRQKVKAFSLKFPVPGIE